MAKITPREQDVMDYIINYMEVNGYSPTTREIANGINTKSMQHVATMLENLKDKNYLTYKPKTPRTIRILKFKI